MQAETHGLLGGTEEGCRIRAIIADMKGELDLRDWEGSSSQTMQHLWMSDCEDLVSHLHNPVTKSVADKRLSIDLVGLRQLIWENQDGSVKDELTKEQPDRVIWIDTSAMIVDCMTKRMKPDLLIKFLNSGILDIRATEESVLLKMKKQKLKVARKAASDSGQQG